jgi:hypothetical protein
VDKKEERAVIVILLVEQEMQAKSKIFQLAR